MTSRNPESKKIAEYAAFDLLRFSLAAIVLFSHTEMLTWSHAGNLAVQVFFALSGWLIGGILYGTTGRELGRFYFNRSTRVWLPYFFSVAALYLTSGLHEHVRSPHWLRYLAYDVTFTHNWFSLWPDAKSALAEMPLQGTGNHFWSLAVEEQFYLVSPLIMTLMPFGRRLVPWLAVAALAYFSGSQYAAIGFGVLAAVTARKYPNWYLVPKATITLVVALVLSAAAMICGPGYDYAAPTFAVCVVLLCARPYPRNGITRWFGAISFPLYLNAWIGMFALHWAEKHFVMPPVWMLKPAEFVAGVFAAALTYAIIDRPVMKYRDAYYSTRLGWSMGVIAYILVLSGIGVWAFSLGS